MLSERKVRLMSRLAKYEKGELEEDFKISTYHKKDYVSFQITLTIIWITVGYAIAVGIVAFCFLDVLLANLNMTFLVGVGLLLVILYLILAITYAVVAASFYAKKYDQARNNIKIYGHDLTRLNRMYEREM